MPERMNEQWCAPDLQAVILQVSQEAIREVLELKNIQRVEPDPVLFEIPRDYTIVEKISQPWSKPAVQSPGQPLRRIQDSYSIKRVPASDVVRHSKPFTETDELQTTRKAVLAAF